MLQRDGESAYYINGTHVRRRDITDMFLGTGLGPRAYAIIEQGMISRVIEARPDELRVFLEEAAGISRYKDRRRETENRLADTRENLARVNDIRTELGAQIEKLEGQAEVASRYKELQEDLQLKQHLLWFLRRKDAAADREKHARDLAAVANEVEAGTAQLREVESRVETARVAHYGAGDALNAAQAAVYEANAEVARHESELRHVEESRHRLEGMHTERQVQLASWREQRSQLTQALHMWAARSGGAQAAGRGCAGQPGDGEPAPARGREELPARAGAVERGAQPAAAGREPAAARAAERRAPRRQPAVAGAAARAPGSRAAGARRAGRGGHARAPMNASLVLEREIGTAQAALDTLQAEAEALGSASAGAADARAAASREHTAADAQLATLKQVQAAAEEDAPLHAWLERHQLGRAAALLAEDAHRARLGNRGRVGVARAPARAGAR